MTIKKAVDADRKLHRLQEDGTELAKKYRALLKQNHQLHAELGASQKIRAGLKTHAILPVHGENTSEATVVVLASDWHVEEEVVPATVNFLNKYNLDIAKKRAHTFFERIVRLVTKEQQDVKIKHVVVFLGGDFITGRLHEENLETCLLRPVDAMIYAQELIASGIEFMLKNSKLSFTFVCKPGNHSRITKRVHAATEAGNALETMMYHNLRERFAGERATFVIEPSYHSYVKVYDYTIRFHHGHNIKYQGGIGGLTIPLHKAIHAWNLTQMADFDCCGHFHDYIAMRRFTVNGSLIGYNAFGLAIKAEFQQPIQSMFLIDKKRGKTVHIPILFDQ
jgi:hypothetical protein